MLKQKKVPLAPARGFLFIRQRFGCPLHTTRPLVAKIEGRWRRRRLPPLNPLTKPFLLTAKPDRPRDETVLKPNRFSNGFGQRRGSVMWASIINQIYHLACRNCLASMARHQHRWI
jgi:hypothetical protein